MSMITSLEGCKMRAGAHLDGGDKDGKWFANVEQVVEHPRLSRIVKQWRKRTKAPETIWNLDGEPVGTLEEALAAYNAKPLPDVSIVERTLLDQIGDEWMATPVAPILMMSLRDKGLIEFHVEQRGQVRRTAVARRVLKGEN